MNYHNSLARERERGGVSRVKRPILWQEKGYHMNNHAKDELS